MKIYKIFSAGLILILSLTMTACDNAEQPSDTSGDSKQEIEQVQEAGTESTDQIEEENIQVNDSDKKEVNETEETNKDTKSTIYIPNLESGAVEAKPVELEEVSIKALFQALKDNKVIKADSNLLAFNIKDIDGVSTIFVNVDKNFYNPNLGVDEEALMLEAFTKTLTKNLSASQLDLRVEGQPYTSGHLSLEEGMYLKYE